MIKSMSFHEKMIEAIIEGNKTQTRRIIRPFPIMDSDGMWHWNDCQWMDGGLGFPLSGIEEHAPIQVGDILSVELPDSNEPGILRIVKRVWAERLHSISPYDITCEGMRVASALLARKEFQKLWDSIYKERGCTWSANPWVWGYSFEVLEQNHAEPDATWVPVKERLPARDERVLTYTPSRIDSDIGPVSVNWGWACSSRANKEITHWMPTPKPPKKDDNE